MSTEPPPSRITLPPPTGAISKHSEIKVISHSSLFYWWPVWALAFFMAIWTWAENRRLAIVPAHTAVTLLPDGSYLLKPPEGKAVRPPEGQQAPMSTLPSAAIESEQNEKYGQNRETFPARVSQESWLGAAFVVGLILTIIITNVPLRGLWSFITLIMIVLVVLVISLFKVWDKIFDALAGLRIYLNLAAYLFIGACVFAVWAIATFIFDRRSYVIFTPGQIRVCEHIGASVETYPTFGVTLEKQRDDLFRHYVLGFGSGDLILHIGTGEKKDIRLPNVLFIGWRLRSIEEMLRSMATTPH